MTNKLIEPFTGSGCIFLNTDYPHYLLAEENADLVHLFQHVQQEGESFLTYCKTLFCAENNHETRYYELRTQFNASTNPRERAALFLYLNKHGYNGLCRYNQKGTYNVPFGRYTQPYFPEIEMRFFHDKSQNATFMKADFRETFALARKGDLIYCDPPYAPIKQASNFSAYTDKKFGYDEQVILADLARKTAEKGITVIISNHDTEFTREQYYDAKIKSFPVKRYISCNSKERIPVTELLAVFSSDN